MVLLILGLIVKKENIEYGIESNKESIEKYKRLRILGWLPFIGVLCIGIYYAIIGFGFFFSTSYGLEAFFGSIFIISFFVWPLYIIGIVLIIKSSSKINALKNQNL